MVFLFVDHAFTDVLHGQIPVTETGSMKHAEIAVVKPVLYATVIIILALPVSVIGVLEFIVGNVMSEIV